MFGERIQGSLHASLVTLPLHNAHRIGFEVEIFPFCVTLLLGLNVLRKYSNILNFGTAGMRASIGACFLNFHYVGDQAFVNPNA